MRKGGGGEMHVKCNSFIEPAYGVYNHKPEKVLTAQ